MSRDEIVEKLKHKFGEKVITHEDLLKEYAEDYTEEEPRLPIAVVKVSSRKDVIHLVKFANGERVPLTPALYRTNVGGLAIPPEGGIVVDMTDMKNIVELNRREMYAIVEPGVTFGQLKEYLKEHAPDLTISYPLAPPDVSILANCIMDGLGNLSFMHGSMGEWIGSMEVVLPDGNVLVTGSAALSPYWFSRAPLPDLTGLFLNWQGTTGIVTKLSVQLWPEPPFRKRFFAFTYSPADGFQILRSLSRNFVFFDLGGLTWPPGKMIFGVENPMVIQSGEPEFYVYADIGGFSKGDLKERVKIFEGVLRTFRSSGVEVEGPVDVDAIVKALPAFASLAEFPMTLKFLIERGGLTWIGTYGPVSKWEEGAERGMKIMLENGIPPTVVTRPMKGGHYGVLRFITVFDRTRKEERRRVRKVNEMLLDMCVELGFVPYKMPPWAWRKLEGKMDKTYIKLMKKIRKLLDPKGIMNPDKLIS